MNRLLVCSISCVLLQLMGKTWCNHLLFRLKVQLLEVLMVTLDSKQSWIDMEISLRKVTKLNGQQNKSSGIFRGQLEKHINNYNTNIFTTFRVIKSIPVSTQLLDGFSGSFFLSETNPQVKVHKFMLESH